MIQRQPTRRALAMSAVLHAVALAMTYWLWQPHADDTTELVDIELAPAPPPVEALPAEVARLREQTHAAPEDKQEPAASSVPDPGEGAAIDAGVDAPIDAPPDARPDARPDAAIDAAEPVVAEADAGSIDAGAVAAIDDAGPGDGGAGDAPVIALGDAGAGDAPQVASTEPGSGSDTSGSGSGLGGSAVGSGGSASEAGSGSGIAGATTEPAVAGAPTTAGTAANLLAYFPQGHVVTALIRFDRLRGSEWAAQTERLLRPMPDYRVLFGPREAKIYDKLETLVISTPAPRDATATTLVGRTKLPRAALRDFLGATTKIAWSAAKGGLYGRRTGPVFRGDKRVFLSPFRGWFLLGQPGDLPGLTAAGAGNLDTIEATAKLPPWLAGIRKIEAESGGDDRGPALVVTIDVGGGVLDLGEYELVIGIKSAHAPERISLAMELAKQGWLVRGNIRFTDEAAAAAFVTEATTVKQRITGVGIYEKVIGKAAIHVLKNLSFARTGPRVSYTTSISIADTRALMAVAAQYLDAYYRAPPP